MSVCGRAEVVDDQDAAGVDDHPVKGLRSEAAGGMQGGEPVVDLAPRVEVEDTVRHQPAAIGCSPCSLTGCFLRWGTTVDRIRPRRNVPFPWPPRPQTDRPVRCAGCDGESGHAQGTSRAIDRRWSLHHVPHT